MQSELDVAAQRNGFHSQDLPSLLCLLKKADCVIRSTVSQADRLQNRRFTHERLTPMASGFLSPLGAEHLTRSSNNNCPTPSGSLSEGRLDVRYVKAKQLVLESEAEGQARREPEPEGSEPRICRGAEGHYQGHRRSQVCVSSLRNTWIEKALQASHQNASVELWTRTPWTPELRHFTSILWTTDPHASWGRSSNREEAGCLRRPVSKRTLQSPSKGGS